MELTDHVEFNYTAGMDEDEVERYLRDTETGVLALTNAGGTAYAIPLAYDYDGETLLFRLSSEDHSRKVEYIEATETACFVVYEYVPPETSWSVLAEGPLHRVGEDDLTSAEVNERFPSLRVFDEALDEVELLFVQMVPDSITGRKSVD